MAITQSALTNNGSTTTGTSFNTASITPTANRLVLVCISSVHLTSANAAAPSGVSGNGITYTLLKNISNTGGGLSTSIWRGMSASPSTGAIMISFANTVARINWSVMELAGINTGGSNGSAAVNSNTASNEDASGTATSITATLAAFGNANNGAVAALGWFMAAASPATCTPDTGWTEGTDAGVTSGSLSLALETQWRASNDTTATGTWNAAGGIQTVAAEIVAAGTFNPAWAVGATHTILSGAG